ncbi:MAG: hypothetical protein J2P59_03140 [Acidimicrobiales bacterium]|nr:hypothetical protein [Acidimicrobiales bacterium]
MATTRRSGAWPRDRRHRAPGGKLRRRAGTVSVVAVALCVLSLLAGACAGPVQRSSTGPTHKARDVSSTRRSTTTVAPTTVPPTTTTLAPTTTTTTVPPTTTTTVAEQPGWTIVSRTGPGIAVDERNFGYGDGAQVVVARFFAGRTRFDLHVGSEDPPTGSAAIPADAGPSVSATEVPLLLGGFNGGFKTGTGAGGFEVAGQVLLPLVSGMASFVTDANGVGHVGVWGVSLPVAGEQVSGVRQNLPPLVAGSAPSPEIGNIGAWGATLGGGAQVARSAVGEDAEGNILYAGAMSALPIDLANALIASGAVTAMELDINPEWVQLALAPGPGGPLSPGVPGQNRPASQFLAGWTRDFVTVLST